MVTITYTAKHRLENWVDWEADLLGVTETRDKIRVWILAHYDPEDNDGEGYGPYHSVDTLHSAGCADASGTPCN